MARSRIRVFVFGLLSVVLWACDRQPPLDAVVERAATPEPIELSPKQSAVAEQGVDDVSFAAEFGAFAEALIAGIKERIPAEEWSLESWDVERTASVVHPLKGHVSVLTTGDSGRWRFQATFVRQDNAWRREYSTTEVLIKGRSFSEPLIGEKDRTLASVVDLLASRLSR